MSSIGNSRNANSTAATDPKTDWNVAVVRGSYKDFKFGNPQPDLSKITPSGKGDSDDVCRQTKFVGSKAVEPADTEQGLFLIGKAEKMRCIISGFRRQPERRKMSGGRARKVCAD